MVSRFSLVAAHQHGDAPHLRTLLRPRRQWPAGRRAAEKADELAPPDHSITSSAMASNLGGNSIPIARAAFMLSTSSNLVGLWTGNSAGLAPFKICPVKTPTCRNASGMLAP